MNHQACCPSDHDDEEVLQALYEENYDYALLFFWFLAFGLLTLTIGVMNVIHLIIEATRFQSDTDGDVQALRFTTLDAFWSANIRSCVYQRQC